MATSEHVWNEYLDEDGLAERYLIPPRTAQRWRADGGGPPFVRLGKRRVVYRVADVERWLAERTYVHRADELARRLAIETDRSGLPPKKKRHASGRLDGQRDVPVPRSEPETANRVVKNDASA